ncbi:MAG TPA: copper-binding protein [Sulfuricella sp.]|nr:copper-binding protein [Sulfuricella sp.]
MRRKLTILIPALAMLAGSASSYAADAATGRGTVNRIDAASATVNISHEAIPALKWPGMTMDFKVADKKLLTNIKAGQKVSFGLVKEPAAGYMISHIEPAKK